jgi:hypothetical protein
MNLSLTMTQSGTTVTGTPVGISQGITLTLVRSAVSGSTATFNGTLKLVGGTCSPATLTGTFTLDAKANTMTGTTAGKNADCNQETDTWTFKRS